MAVDEFVIYDRISDINENSRTIEEISPYEVDEINSRIDDKMKKVDLEFGMKNAGSNESAKHDYVTFNKFFY